MKLLIKFLTLIFAAFAFGNHCKIIDENYLEIYYSQSNPTPDHIINGENVGCATNTVHVPIKNIKSITIATFEFDDFNLFENCTILRIFGYGYTHLYKLKTIRKETFIRMKQIVRINIAALHIQM